MATSWILGKISDALQPTIHSTVSTAGGFAGGALNTVGSSINGVGESIGGTIKRYGDGFRDYGNGVMDWSDATGPRAQTASNPLGLGAGTSQGKSSVTSPSIYSAGPRPKPLTSKTVTTPSPASQSQKRARGTTVKKPISNGKTAVPVKKKTPVPVVSAPVPKATQTMKRPTVGTVSNTTTKKATTGKASTATANKTRLPSTQATSIAAANPLGLK